MGFLGVNWGGVGNSIQSTVSDFGSWITGGWNNLMGTVSTGLNSVINGNDLVGISVQNIPDMKDAVRQAVQNLDNKLNEFRAAGQPAQAFSGQYRDAIIKYIDAVKEATQVLTSQLLVFNDRLDQVGTNYVIRDGVVAESITDAGTKLDKEKYQEENVGVQSQ